MLLEASGDALGLILRDSAIESLVLNGASVVRQFNLLIPEPLESKLMAGWSLPRVAGPNIPGFAYSGVIEELGGIELATPVQVLGYNHNLQSSFGVTRDVVNNISAWVAAHAGTAFAA